MTVDLAVAGNGCRCDQPSANFSPHPSHLGIIPPDHVQFGLAVTHIESERKDASEREGERGGAREGGKVPFRSRSGTTAAVAAKKRKRTESEKSERGREGERADERAARGPRRPVAPLFFSCFCPHFEQHISTQIIFVLNKPFGFASIATLQLNRHDLASGISGTFYPEDGQHSSTVRPSPLPKSLSVMIRGAEMSVGLDELGPGCIP